MSELHEKGWDEIGRRLSEHEPTVGNTDASYAAFEAMRAGGGAISPSTGQALSAWIWAFAFAVVAGIGAYIYCSNTETVATAPAVQTGPVTAPKAIEKTIAPKPTTTDASGNSGQTEDQETSPLASDKSDATDRKLVNGNFGPNQGRSVNTHPAAGRSFDHKAVRPDIEGGKTDFNHQNNGLVENPESADNESTIAVSSLESVGPVIGRPSEKTDELLAAVQIPINNVGPIHWPSSERDLSKYLRPTQSGRIITRRGPGLTFAVAGGLQANLGRQNSFTINQPTEFAFVELGKSLSPKLGLGARIGLSLYGSAEQSTLTSVVAQDEKMFRSPLNEAVSYRQEALVDAMGSADFSLLAYYRPAPNLSFHVGGRASYVRSTLIYQSNTPNNSLLVDQSTAQIENIDFGSVVGAEYRIIAGLSLGAEYNKGLRNLIPNSNEGVPTDATLRTTSLRAYAKYRF